MKRYIILCISILVLTCSLLAGCGESQADIETDYKETTIRIDKKGSVSETIIEPFDKDYYDIDELKEEFLQDINEYNSSKTDETVKLKSIKLENGNVNVQVEFASTEDYKNLVKEDLYYGTINDAYDSGYKMDIAMKGTKEGNKIGKVEIMGMKDKEIVILSEHVKVSVPRNIEYVTANVEVLSEKEARVVSESGGLAYLVLSR